MACYGSNVPSGIESAYQPKVVSVLKAIADGERLTHVDLSDCGLTSIPSELFQLGDSLVLLNLGEEKYSQVLKFYYCIRKIGQLITTQVEQD